MSIIQIPILYAGSKGDKHLSTLFDSGAHLSCINPKFIEELEILFGKRAEGLAFGIVHHYRDEHQIHASLE